MGDEGHCEITFIPNAEQNAEIEVNGANAYVICDEFQRWYDEQVAEAEERRERRESREREKAVMPPVARRCPETPISDGDTYLGPGRSRAEPADDYSSFVDEPVLALAA